MTIEPTTEIDSSMARADETVGVHRCDECDRPLTKKPHLHFRAERRLLGYLPGLR
jgi:hypothetical protein